MLCSLTIFQQNTFFQRISNKPDDAQSVNAMKNNGDGLFVKRLRSLFPAIEIKIEHVRFRCLLHFVFILILFIRDESLLDTTLYPTDY